VIRLVRAYGTDTALILSDADKAEALGKYFGAGLFEQEIIWLIDREFAQTAEDILWRRSKLGLHMDDAEKASVNQWFADNQAKQKSAISVS